jgi:DNA-directed RNA polymerase I and III subunit RPAC2
LIKASKMEEKVKIAIENDGIHDEFCKTFVLIDEDHTLANSLRYLIMKNPDVLFCGYSIPHPSEAKVNFRIQSKSVPAIDILEKGLVDLNSVCEHVLNTFEDSINDFKNNKMEM